MWTDHKVIESIIRCRAQGFDLGATRYEDHGLFVAARVQFGTWNKALVAAGIDAVLREQWDEEKGLMRIRKLAVDRRDTDRANSKRRFEANLRRRAPLRVYSQSG